MDRLQHYIYTINTSRNKDQQEKDSWVSQRQHECFHNEHTSEEINIGRHIWGSCWVSVWTVWTSTCVYSQRGKSYLSITEAWHDMCLGSTPLFPNIPISHPSSVSFACFYCVSCLVFFLIIFFVILRVSRFAWGGVSEYAYTYSLLKQPCKHNLIYHHAKPSSYLYHT